MRGRVWSKPLKACGVGPCYSYNSTPCSLPSSQPSSHSKRTSPDSQTPDAHSAPAPHSACTQTSRLPGHGPQTLLAAPPRLLTLLTTLTVSLTQVSSVGKLTKAGFSVCVPAVPPGRGVCVPAVPPRPGRLCPCGPPQAGVSLSQWSPPGRGISFPVVPRRPGRLSVSLLSLQTGASVCVPVVPQHGAQLLLHAGTHIPSSGPLPFLSHCLICFSPDPASLLPGVRPSDPSEGSRPCLPRGDTSSPSPVPHSPGAGICLLLLTVAQCLARRSCSVPAGRRAGHCAESRSSSAEEPPGRGGKRQGKDSTLEPSGRGGKTKATLESDMGGVTGTECCGDRGTCVTGNGF